MKKTGLVLLYLFLVVFMMNYFVPIKDLDFSLLLPPEKEVEESTDFIQVSVARKTTTIQVPLEEYLIGVVGSEMPSSFELEALKAQCIAARTFVVNRKFQVDDSTATQAYHSEAELLKIWGDGAKERIAKIKQAVDATSGLIMTYQGKVISALYFSTSNGMTANSEEYYTSALPYLRSVSSPWDLELNPKASTTVFFTPVQLKASLQLSSEVSSFQVVSRYKDNRVNQAKANATTLTGREVREKLGLKSSDFTIRKTKNGYELVTQGNGHGVGMSQYGAQGLALEGKSYQDILQYYYQNIEIISLGKYKGL